MSVYDPTTPAIAQNDPWSCAPTSARWAMTAWGRHPTEQWFESTMLAEGVVSKEDGLLDGSGAGLAAWLTKEYSEFNYAAHSNGNVSFDDVRSVAGSAPVLIGGHKWGPGGHWSGVRGYDPNADVLLLANPAEGYTGISQTMTRQQFTDRSPFSMVVVTWTDPAPPAPAPEPPAAATGYVVGPGLLDAMTRRGEVPATSEVYFGEGSRGWSEAFSSLGRRYTYLASSGKIIVDEGWGP